MEAFIILMVFVVLLGVHVHNAKRFARQFDRLPKARRDQIITQYLRFCL